MVRRTSILAVLGFVFFGLALPSSLLAQQSQNNPLDNLIRALHQVDQEVQTLKSLDNLEAGDVEVVNTAMLLNDQQQKAFEKAVQQQSELISSLRETLKSMPSITKALSNSQAAAENVVALNTKDDQTVVVYHYLK